MNKDKVFSLRTPAEKVKNALTIVRQERTRKLLAKSGRGEGELFSGAISAIGKSPTRNS